MNMDFKIIYPLPVDRWEEYKVLRIESIASDSIAFGLTEQEECSWPDTFWKNRLNKDGITKMIFAERKGQLVGMIGLFYEPLEKIKHVCQLHSFFVNQGFRKHGIGKLLIEKAVVVAQGYSFRKITLNVTTTQEAAISLYESLDFSVTGISKEEIFSDGKYYDQYSMALFLRQM